MAKNSAPLPPLLPPLPSSQPSLTSASSVNGKPTDQLIESEEGSIKSRIIFKKYRNVDPQLQEGPTCGLVALSMALGNSQYDAEELKKLATSNGWSMNGEMFSCEWMACLAEKVGAKCVRIQGGLLNNLQHISDCFLGGGFVLVPYDKTGNNDPGTFGGTKAHWAVLLGLCLMKVDDTDSDCEVGSHWQLAHPEGFSVSILSPNKLKFDRVEGQFPTARLYVYAIQGLSRYARRWELSTLAESNGNLTTVDPKRNGLVCLPDGGISSGLRDQALLIWN